jgi:uncharacterized membrane protein
VEKLFRGAETGAMQTTFTPVILVHTFAAFTAIALGAGMFLARKGTSSHRIAGRGWVALMLVTAVSSFWIQTKGHFSLTHLLSVAVPLMLAAGVYFALTRRIVRHQRMMIGIYALGLGLAGLFTLLPHRLLGRMLWSNLGLI